MNRISTEFFHVPFGRSRSGADNVIIEKLLGLISDSEFATTTRFTSAS